MGQTWGRGFTHDPSLKAGASIRIGCHNLQGVVLFIGQAIDKRKTLFNNLGNLGCCLSVSPLPGEQPRA
jgi:hypothetical protein